MSHIFSIIYQNDDFAVISKLKEASFHSENGPGLFSILQDEFKSVKIYPVHRLDRVTTGLLLIAKNREAASELGKLFESREIDKYYIALSDMCPQASKMIIKGDMKKSRRGMWKLLKSMQNPAVTEFESFELPQRLYFFLIKIMSGKTHQIRVALKSAGSPVLGDPLYYPKPKMKFQPDRTYLHSYCMKFSFKGENFVFTDYPGLGAVFNGEKTGKAIREILAKFHA